MKNNCFIINPLVIFFGGGFTWLMIFWLAPLKTDVDFYFRCPAFDYALISYLSLVGGIVAALLLTIHKKQIKFDVKSLDIESLKMTLFILLTVCFVGNLLQSIDFVMKGASGRSLAGIVSNYRGVDSIYPAPFAYFSLITMKLSILPIFIIMLSGKRIHISNPWLYYISLLMAIYPLVNLVVFGKRAYDK